MKKTLKILLSVLGLCVIIGGIVAFMSFAKTQKIKKEKERKELCQKAEQSCIDVHYMVVAVMRNLSRDFLELEYGGQEGELDFRTGHILEEGQTSDITKPCTIYSLRENYFEYLKAIGVMQKLEELYKQACDYRQSYMPGSVSLGLKYETIEIINEQSIDFLKTGKCVAGTGWYDSESIHSYLRSYAGGQILFASKAKDDFITLGKPYESGIANAQKVIQKMQDDYNLKHPRK